MKNKKYLLFKVNLLIAVFTITLLSSCALMFNGGKDQVIKIEGKDGTKVLISTPSGSYEDKLPTEVISRSSNIPIEIEVIDNRYQKASSIVDKKIVGSFWVNLVSITGVGFVIDAVAGSMWDYDAVTEVKVIEK